MTRWLLLACALVACGGESEQQKTSKRLLAKMSEFTDKMCACKPGDKTCADKVTEEMTAWGKEMAKEAKADAKPDPDLAQRAQGIMERYTKCATAAMTPASALAEGSGSSSPGASSTTEKKLPAAPKQSTVEAFVVSAREAAAARDKKLVLSKLEARYVKSDGTLHPEYGELEFDFRHAPSPKDDPNRPIGAPAPPPPADDSWGECPTWMVQAGKKWSEITASCKPERVLQPRCSVAQVWARAIKDDKAPEAALARVSLNAAADGEQSWFFSIVDKPRNIDITKTYPDDCTPVVEK